LLAQRDAVGIHQLPPLETFGGKPRERGLTYGKKYRDAIQEFLNKELYSAFHNGPASKDDLLRYAGDCAHSVKTYSRPLHEELEGVAEGAAIELEEITLITLHEELYHRGALPKVPHCTAVAVGPPLTDSGETLVGQTWDWMESVFGLSRLLHWHRDEGPSLLAYGFPGMFCGAGLNSAGLALCWTSAGLGDQTLGVRIGLPSYVLLTHLLYQESLEDVMHEAKRATNAGWFTFVMADARGRLLNIEGSPEKIVIETAEGMLARVGYGSREMTGASPKEPAKLHERCERFGNYVNGHTGRMNARRLQELFGDPAHAISVGKGTIDMMVYDTTSRTAWLSRGPSYGVAWQKFEFPV
jgi:isopenicillin-N N-acyltransferase-like protein